MRNRNLIFIFTGLVALYLLSLLFRGNRQSSFDPELVKTDTSLVSEIRLYPKAEGNTLVTLAKNGDTWTAKKGDMTANIPPAKMKGMLSQLALIRSDRVVSRDKNKWPEYEVNETGSRVEVYAGRKKVADFVVGTFKFDQAKRSASSYLRKSDGDEVYLIDGFMSMTFNQDFNSYRNNEVIKLNREDVRDVTRIQNGEKIILQKNPEDGLWYRGGMELLDSTKAVQYINQLTNVYGGEFATQSATGTAVASLEISGNNLVTPLRVDCFASQDTAFDFIIHSSGNPDAWFGSDSSGIYRKIFQTFEELLYTGQ